MAGRDRSADSGGGAQWSNDVRAYRHDAGAKSERRARIQSRSQGDALGEAEAEAGSMIKPSQPFAIAVKPALADSQKCRLGSF
jgi:hypothetical protein